MKGEHNITNRDIAIACARAVAAVELNVTSTVEHIPAIEGWPGKPAWLRELEDVARRQGELDAELRERGAA